MWAAGIITFQLVYGRHPFEESTDSRSEMEARLKKYTEISFPKTGFNVSLQAKHMIS